MYINRTEIADALRDSTFYKEANRFEECGIKGLVLACPNPSHNYRGYIPLRCDLRICLDCGKRFAAKIFCKYQDFIKAVLSHPKRAYSLKFLTLTKANRGKTQDPIALREEMQGFFKNVRKFMNKLFSKSSASGGIAILEIGENFNIHAHILVFGRYFPQDYLSDVWKEINAGESYIVHIQRVRGKARFVLGYLLKYISKPYKFKDPIDYAVYLIALKGVRRVHSFGIFYNIQLPERAIVLKCPYCGKRLVPDGEFYEFYGKLGIQNLDSFGIHEVCFS
jgi:hypothetical protein